MRKKRRITLLIFLLISLAGLSIGGYLSFTSNQAKRCEDLFLQAKKLQDEGKIEDVLYAFRVLVTNFPQSKFAPLSYYEMGKIYEFKLKDFKEARLNFEKVCDYSDCPYKEEARYKVEIYKKKGHEFYKEVIKGYPEWDSPKLERLIESAQIRDIQLLQVAYPQWDKAEELLFARGKVYKRGGNLDQAQQSFQELISKYPKADKVPLSYLEIGDILYQLKRYPQALLTLKNLIKQYPESRWVDLAHLGRGEIYCQLANYDQAIQEYQKVQRASNLKVELFSGKDVELCLGECYQAKDEWEIAANVFQRFIQGLPPKEDLTIPELTTYHRWRNYALLRLAYSYENLGNWAGAIATYKKVYLVGEEELSEGEASVQALLGAGRAYYYLGKINKAYSLSKKALRLYPRSKGVPQALYWIGRCKEAKGEEVAPQYYKRILEKFPQGEENYLSYYQYIRKRQREIKKINPCPSAREEEEEKIAKSIGDLIIKELRTLSRDAVSHFIIADIYWHQERYKEAKEHLRKASSLDPKKKRLKRAYLKVQTYAYKPKGIPDLVKGINLREKIKDWEKRVKDDPRSAKAYFNLGEAYQGLGWVERAYSSYSQAIGLDKSVARAVYLPNIKEILQNLDTISSKTTEQLSSLLKVNFLSPEAESIWQESREDIKKRRGLLLIIQANLICGLKGEEEKEEMSKDLKETIDDSLWRLVKTKYRPVVPPTIEQEEAQDNLLRGTFLLREALEKIIKAGDDYSLSQIDPRGGWKEQMGRLVEFKESYLSSFEF